VVDLHSALGQQFVNIVIGESIAELSAPTGTITSRGNRKPVNTDGGGRTGQHGGCGA
jgi:hypothetical protein